MIITEPFKNAANPYDTKHPVVVSIAIDQSNIKVLMHGVGAVLHMQYSDIVHSRHWRDLGLEEQYIKYELEDFGNDPAFEVPPNHFVLKVKGNDIQTVLNALQKITVIDEAQKAGCDLQLKMA